MIIGITGRPGAGKSEVSRILESMGFVVIEMGSVIKSEMIKKGIEPTPKNTKEFMLHIREMEGDEVIAKKTVEDVLIKNNDNIVITGIRSLTEVEYFKKYIKNIKMLAIKSPQETRFKRLNKRGRSDDPKTFGEFINYRENNETKVGIDEAIESSEYVIENSGTVEELQRSVFLVLEDMNK